MSKIFRKCLAILDTWYFTAVKIALIALYSVIVAAYSNIKLEQEIRGKTDFSDWLMSHPLAVILSAAIIAIIYQAIYKLLINYSKSIYDKSEVAITLVTALERPVGKKRERFAEEVDNFLRLKSSKYTTNKVFKAITKPEEQSKLILEALEDFFRHAYEELDFKVGLMAIKDDEVDDWKYFLPRNSPPRTSLEDLRRKESTISRCISSMQTEIIPDVKKEITKQKNGVTIDTRYVKGATSDKEDWSQICYPIISVTTKKVIYVITIAASQKNFFKQSERKNFEWVLEKFAIRLALEHSLECLLLQKL
jgi:hypothetical protein